MKIDRARRAEIGRDRRAKTRAQVMNAARALFSQNGFDTVTVDDVVRRAKVARGTFYVHFADVEDLRAAVADELIQALETMRRPDRIRTTNPLERIAAGSFAFIHQALVDPAWGRLVALAAWALPTVGLATRADLAEDVRDALAHKRISAIPLELGIAIVTGIVLHTMRSASEKRLGPSDVPVALTAILLSLGVSRREATATARRTVKALSPGPISGDIGPEAARRR